MSAFCGVRRRDGGEPPSCASAWLEEKLDVSRKPGALYLTGKEKRLRDLHENLRPEMYLAI